MGRLWNFNQSNPEFLLFNHSSYCRKPRTVAKKLVQITVNHVSIASRGGYLMLRSSLDIFPFSTWGKRLFWGQQQQKLQLQFSLPPAPGLRCEFQRRLASSRLGMHSCNFFLFFTCVWCQEKETLKYENCTRWSFKVHSAEEKNVSVCLLLPAYNFFIPEVLWLLRKTIFWSTSKISNVAAFVKSLLVFFLGAFDQGPYQTNS